MVQIFFSKLDLFVLLVIQYNANIYEVNIGLSLKYIDYFIKHK